MKLLGVLTAVMLFVNSGILVAFWLAGVPGADSIDIAIAAGSTLSGILLLSLLGHHRTRRGVYDLLFRAMKACGLDRR